MVPFATGSPTGDSAGGSTAGSGRRIQDGECLFRVGSASSRRAQPVIHLSPLAPIAEYPVSKVKQSYERLIVE
jgi:hypothetical protein